MINFDKLVLGTAQLTREYGAESLYSNSPSRENARNILRTSLKLGINKLDTSPVYADAETAIAEFENSHRCRVQTKWNNSLGDVRKQVGSSLSALNVDHVWGVLLHNSVLDNPHQVRRDLEQLADLQHQGILEKVGFSVYSREELDELIGLEVHSGIVQLPFNPLMKDILYSPQVELLVKRGFVIQLRSIYMQGMLASKSRISNSGSLPAIESARILVQKIANRNGVSSNYILLRYALDAIHSPEVLVGATHPDELRLLEYHGDAEFQDCVSELDLALSKIHLSSFEKTPSNWSRLLT